MFEQLSRIENRGSTLDTIFKILSDDPGCTMAKNSLEAFLDAAMKNDDAKAQYIGQGIGFDFNTAHTLWILHGGFNGSKREERYNALTKWAREADSFFGKISKKAHIAFRGDGIAIFMECIPYAELEEGSEQDFLSGFAYNPASLTAFHKLCSIEDIRHAIELHDDFIFYASKVYPKKQVFYEQDLQFAGLCKLIAASGKIFSLRSLLEPLRDNKSGDVLADTLATYLLDADGSAQKAGDLMHQHKNTIQYRLHVIQQRLSLDIKKMPANFNLYLAVGIDRLTQS